MNKQYLRYFLYGILIALGLILWNTWQKEHETPARSVETNQQSVQTSSAEKQTVVSERSDQSIPSSRLIHVKTNVLNIDIDRLNGNIVRAALLKYPETLKDKNPVVLLNNDPNTLYIALTGNFHDGKPSSKLLFKSKKTQFELKSDQKELVVNLKAKNAKGIEFIKTYVFKPDQYAIDVNYQVNNQSNNAWNGRYFMELTRKDSPEVQKKIGKMHSFFGIAISSPEEHYQKFKFSKLSKSPINEMIKSGWMAMVQHYFLCAWVPHPDETYHYYSRIQNSDIYTGGTHSESIEVLAHQSKILHSTLYIGPKIAKNLDAIAPHLSLTIDYGWLWFIAVMIFWLLKKIYLFVGNWGWSIVIVTILIKLLFYHLSEVSYKSMAGMRDLQPKINRLKEQYGDDKQSMGRAMMKLYKDQGINPLGGCLPILIQIPVFIALYWVLLESVELRQAPFIFWIHDLSVKDPYYVLPILMGITMFIQQKMSPPPPDPTQAKVMMLLPVIMTAFFLAFPAGLVLYWFVNNLLSVLQQYYIMKKYARGAYKKKDAWKKK